MFSLGTPIWRHAIKASLSMIEPLKKRTSASVSALGDLPLTIDFIASMKSWLTSGLKCPSKRSARMQQRIRSSSLTATSPSVWKAILTSWPCCTSRLTVPPIETITSSGWGLKMSTRLG